MTLPAAVQRRFFEQASKHPPRRLNLAIYYPWLYLKSGGERTILELVTRSRHQWTIITNRYDRDATYPGLKNVSIVELDSVSTKRNFREVFCSAFRIVTQRLPLDGFDAALVFCEGLGDLVVFRNSGAIPFACYCFTPLRAAFDDLYQSHYLSQTGNSMFRRLVLFTGAALFRVIDRRAWKRYDHIFAISNEVKRRILNGNLCGPEKLSLLYAGIDFAALERGGRYDSYFLLPGRIMWTKNTELGLQSFLSFKKACPQFAHFKLLIAGFVDKKSRLYLEKLQGLARSRTDIEFVVDPSDAALFDLYRNCYSVIYTPFNEDMGLIPVEAMAAGKPVLTVNCGGPREIVSHGRTGFLLKPEPLEFSRTMQLLADDPKRVRSMGAAGREDASRFDWSHFYETVDSYFDELADRWRPR